MTDIRVKGLPELGKFLQTLAPKLEANILRAALASGARIVRDAARAGVPVAPPSRKNARVYAGYEGALRKSIRFGSRVNLYKGKVVAYIRAGGHARSQKADTYYAKFVEYGTRPHDNGLFMHPGAQPRPFMRPALDREAEHALRVIANFIKMRLETKHGLDTKAVVLDDPI